MHTWSTCKYALCHSSNTCTVFNRSVELFHGRKPDVAGSCFMAESQTLQACKPLGPRYASMYQSSSRKSWAPSASHQLSSGLRPSVKPTDCYWRSVRSVSSENVIFVEDMRGAAAKEAAEEANFEVMTEDHVDKGPHMQLTQMLKKKPTRKLSQ